jgi:hypothetical protein
MRTSSRQKLVTAESPESGRKLQHLTELGVKGMQKTIFAMVSQTNQQKCQSLDTAAAVEAIGTDRLIDDQAGTKSDTFGHAAERDEIICAECDCGLAVYFLATDLARVWGKSRQIRHHRFKCARCRSTRLKLITLQAKSDLDLGHAPC